MVKRLCVSMCCIVEDMDQADPDVLGLDVHNGENWVTVMMMMIFDWKLILERQDKVLIKENDSQLTEYHTYFENRFNSPSNLIFVYPSVQAHPAFHCCYYYYCLKRVPYCSMSDR